AIISGGHVDGAVGRRTSDRRLEVLRLMDRDRELAGGGLAASVLSSAVHDGRADGEVGAGGRNAGDGDGRTATRRDRGRVSDGLPVRVGGPRVSMGWTLDLRTAAGADIHLERAAGKIAAGIRCAAGDRGRADGEGAAAGRIAANEGRIGTAIVGGRRGGVVDNRAAGRGVVDK